jgi:hypothetical protein
MGAKPNRRLRWLARNTVVPLSAVADVPKVLLSPELDTLSQRLAAIFVLFRLRFWRLFDAVRLLAASRPQG